MNLKHSSILNYLEKIKIDVVSITYRKASSSGKPVIMLLVIFVQNRNLPPNNLLSKNKIGTRAYILQNAQFINPTKFTKSKV